MRLGPLLFVSICLLLGAVFGETDNQIDAKAPAPTTAAPAAAPATTAVAPKKKPAIILQPELTDIEKLREASEKTRTAVDSGPHFTIPIDGSTETPAPLNTVTFTKNPRERVSSSAHVVGGDITFNSPEAVEADLLPPTPEDEPADMFEAPKGKVDPLDQNALSHRIAFDEAVTKNAEPLMRQYFKSKEDNPDSVLPNFIFPPTVKKNKPPPPPLDSKKPVEFSYSEIKQAPPVPEEFNDNFPFSNYSLPELIVPSAAPVLTPSKDDKGNIVLVIPASSLQPPDPNANFTVPEFKSDAPNPDGLVLTPAQQAFDNVDEKLDVTPNYKPAFALVPMGQDVNDIERDTEIQKREYNLRLKGESKVEAALQKAREDLRKAKLANSAAEVEKIRAVIAYLTDAGRLDPFADFSPPLSSAQFHKLTKTGHSSTDGDDGDADDKPRFAHSAQHQIDDLKRTLISVDEKLNKLIKVSVPENVDEENDLEDNADDEVTVDASDAQRVVTNLDASRDFVSKLLTLRKKRAA